jgi:Peptidase family M48
VPAERGDDSRLDPFAFAPETKGRFLMLIMVALALTAGLGFSLVRVAGGGAISSRELQAVLTEIKVSREQTSSGFPMGDLKPLTQRWQGFHRDRLRDRVARLLLPAGLIALTSAGALILYRRHPQRIRRRHGSSPLSRGEAPRIVAELEELCTRQGLAPVRLETQSGFAQGHAFGLPGEEVLLLHGTPEMLERSWGEMQRAIAAHELAHLANGDAQDREKARAVWIAFSVLFAGSAGCLLLFAGGRFSWLFLAKLGVVLAAVWMIRAGLIRIRELYADWRAVSWGAGPALEKVLALGERETDWWERSRWWWRAWERWGDRPWWERVHRFLEIFRSTRLRYWRMHPTSDVRRDVLRDPSRLFGIPADLPFLTGLLLSLVFTNLLPLILELLLTASTLTGMISSYILSLAADLPAGSRRDLAIALTGGINITLPFLAATGVLFFLSFLVTRSLGAQVQRKVVADLVEDSSGRWGYAGLLRPALLLALGLEAGFWIAPFVPLEPRTAPGLAAVPVWLLGFAFFAWLWLAYTYALSRFLLGAHAGRENPRTRRALITGASVGLLTVLFWPASLARLAVTTAFLLEPGASLPGGFDPRQAYIYGIFITMMVLLVGATVLYALWACLSLFLVWAGALRQRHRCPSCLEVTRFRIVLGRRCQGCGGTLSPWAFLRPEALRGEGARHAT